MSIALTQRVKKLERRLEALEKVVEDVEKRSFEILSQNVKPQPEIPKPDREAELRDSVSQSVLRRPPRVSQRTNGADHA